MTWLWAGRAEQLQPQQAAHGVRRRNHPAAGKTGLWEDAVQIGRPQHGQEQEQATEAGAELADSDPSLSKHWTPACCKRFEWIW
jgi:hypothetical protein